MKVINYEERKYRTLLFSDFCTTEIFEYEEAHIKGFKTIMTNDCTINSNLLHNIILSSKSAHLIWERKLFDTNNKLLLKHIKIDFKYNKGMFRRKIYNNIFNDIFYLKKKRDTYISDIYNLYNIYLKNMNNGDSISRLFWYFKNINCKKSLEIAKYYLNGHTEEFLKLFLQYIKYKFYYSNVYIKQSKSGELPLITKQKKNKMQKLREKILSGYVLTFVYNGLIIEVKQPIINTIGNVYNFSHSIFINNKPMSELTEEEQTLWEGSKEKNNFRTQLFELINSSVNYIVANDPDNILINCIINVRPYRKGEVILYEIEYIESNKEIRKKQILYEFNEERARIKAMYLCKLFENQIMSIKPK